MSAHFIESGNYKNFTSTNNITFSGALQLIGFFASSSTSGTIRVQDGSTTVVNTFTCAAGTFYRVPATLTSGTCTITVTGTLDACCFFATA